MVKIFLNNNVHLHTILNPINNLDDILQKDRVGPFGFKYGFFEKTGSFGASKKTKNHLFLTFGSKFNHAGRKIRRLISFGFKIIFPTYLSWSLKRPLTFLHPDFQAIAKVPVDLARRWILGFLLNRDVLQEGNQIKVI